MTEMNVPDAMWPLKYIAFSLVSSQQSLEYKCMSINNTAAG
jgi:hypothetical protein